MSKLKSKLIGRWLITSMEMWDQDFIDLETEGHFTFEKDELGSFHFGAVRGTIDYRVERIGDIEKIEFTWEGQDEMNDALGRGWAIRTEDQIEGRFYFHLGDDSWFKAKKMK